MQTLDQPDILPPDDIGSAQTMYLILYPDGYQEEVVQLLDGVGVPGFTETRKVTGRGTRGHHFDNSVWPGAEGMIYVVVGSTHRRALASALANYNRSLELRSRGLSGLHVFTWQCDQLV